MKSTFTLLIGAGLLLAAILRPTKMITLLWSLLKIPTDIVNTVAGLQKRELRAK